MTNAVIGIARQELVQLLRHPASIILALVLITLVCIGVAGVYNMTYGQLTMSIGYQANDPVYLGAIETIGLISGIFLIMSAFLGAMSIPYDRWNHSYNVLLGKPVRRRDIILGKFAGLSGFMLLLNAFVFVVSATLSVAFIGEPNSQSEYWLWVCGLIAMFTLTCSAIIALNLLIGTISKNFLVVASLSFVYITIELFWYKDWFLRSLSWLTPINLNPGGDVFGDGMFFLSNLGSVPVPNSLVHLAVLLIELAGFLLAGVYLFTREDIT